ncbi:MAG: toll/interleukin-1 receptor domain-containing protein [Acidobacteriota bacterium]|jgi:hypothetical protein
MASRKVFLCFAPEDDFKVENVARTLRDAGISVVYDKWNRLPGESSPRGLPGRLEPGSALLLFLSRKLAAYHKKDPWALESLADKARVCAVRIVLARLDGIGPKRFPAPFQGADFVDLRREGAAAVVEPLKHEMEDAFHVDFGNLAVAVTGPRPNPAHRIGGAYRNVVTLRVRTFQVDPIAFLILYDGELAHFDGGMVGPNNMVISMAFPAYDSPFPNAGYYSALDALKPAGRDLRLKAYSNQPVNAVRLYRVDRPPVNEDLTLPGTWYPTIFEEFDIAPQIWRLADLS